MKTVRQANTYLRWAVKHLDKFSPNECLKRARLPYDIGIVFPTAKTGYEHTEHRFTGRWVPGAFAWWETASDWHVAVCAYRKGYVFSTDQRLIGGHVDPDTGLPYTGHYDRVPLTQICETWGRHVEFVGFSLDVNNQTPVKLPKIRRAFP